MKKCFAVATAALCLASGSAAADCKTTANPAGMSYRSWGVDLSNTRYQPHSRIDANNVEDLEVAWVFALGDDDSPHSQPLISEDTIYVGDPDGMVYALDRDSGCTRWEFRADTDIRSAIVAGQVTLEAQSVSALFFGTREGTVWAIRADNGQELWHIEADPHPYAIVTGTPIFHDNVLYVPVSSYEVIMAAMPWYGCCDFRGSVMAVDARNGKTLWQTYTVEQPAEVTSKYLLKPNKYGPSGAPVWSSPTLDLARGWLLFGSGENYSDPPTATSDAITALSMATGEVVWRRQFTEGDAWNAACNSPLDHNCPDADGPDLDFGAPPVIARIGTQDWVFAGQKSANVFAMNADNGDLLWEQRVGRGGMLGGIHWGIAYHPPTQTVYVPISDRSTGASEFTPQPGIHALDATTGKPRWFSANKETCTKDKEDCHSGMSAAIVVNDSLLFAGSLDGWVHAYDPLSGERVWQFDTWRAFTPVNDIDAHGGAIDVHGPVLHDDLLIVTSGYAGFGQGGGNAMIVFRLPTSGDVTSADAR